MDRTPNAGERTPRLLTLTEAAETLSVAPRTLRTLIASGAISTIRVSTRRLAIHPDDLARFVASRRQGAS